MLPVPLLQFEGLTPEEDYVVPGTYRDALNGNTRLGKAVRAACAELDTLNNMVRAGPGNHELSFW